MTPLNESAQSYPFLLSADSNKVITEMGSGFGQKTDNLVAGNRRSLSLGLYGKTKIGIPAVVDRTEQRDPDATGDRDGSGFKYPSCEGGNNARQHV